MASNRRPKALVVRSLVSSALTVAAMALASHAAIASTVYGDLNNFDAVNDTGQVCHGFEIEIEGVRSTDISYTYDWNHYGPPKITEDITTDPTKPRVFVRYESAKNVDGTWKLDASTWVPTETLQPTDGHFCTDTTNYSFGCEHFGVGYYGTPTAMKFNWLLDDGAGNLIPGPAVNVGAPTFTYIPPAPAQPAQVVAVIPAPVAPNPEPADAGKEFGEATWVKVIKTTTHNAENVALADLVSADSDGDGTADWQNNEPAEVETEWKLLQKHYGGAGDGVNEALEGGPDDMGDGSETVTRRYEFYNYVRYVSAAGANPGDPLVDSLDGENGEAMCSEIEPTTNPADPNYLHGVEGENNVAVTGVDADSGETYTYHIDCSAQVMIGDYIGAQMVGFDAAAPLGLVDNLQDGDTSAAYTPRTVVVGGNSPYTITVTPTDGLPPGMTLGDYMDPDTSAVAPGVLSGSPTTPGSYSFTVDARDHDGAVVSRSYTLQVVGPAPQQWALNVSTIGSGTVTGSGIDCGSTCSVTLDDGSTATLAATPAADSVFAGWSGACSGSGSCEVNMTGDASVTASFAKKQYSLTVGKTGGGGGSVAGNGIDCGATCSVTLDTGTAVTLTATPDSNSVFTGWSGGGCSGTADCVLTLGADTTVSATFAPAPTQYSLTVTTIGPGTVTSSPKVRGSINCGNKCTGSFTAGSSVTLTAKPKKKHVFVGWSGGACSGTSATCTVEMLDIKAATATFN